MANDERDAYAERAAYQHLGSRRHSTSARPPKLDARLSVDGWPLDRGQLDQIDALETLENVTEGDEGLVVERLPRLQQDGMLLGRPLIKLLFALKQTLVPPSVRLREPDDVDYVDGHIAP
ncbi:hypothetical protein [Streptomyces decoyicus]